MREALKVNIECVFSNFDKMEGLNKLNSLRKTLYSDFEINSDISINLFELIDDISLMTLDKATDVDNHLISIRIDENKESEMTDKHN